MGIYCTSKPIRRNNRLEWEKMNKIKKFFSEEEIDNLNKFLDINEFQKDFYKNTEDNDIPFNILKKEEEIQLILEFNRIRSNYSKKLYDKFNNIFQLDNKKNNLILNTIKNENTENIYKKKIIEEIKTIEDNDSNYSIEYLTILLIGRKGIGKTTLINYILNIKINNENDLIINSSDENYTIYQIKNFHLKLIEFKSFGLSENPKKTGQIIVDNIMKLVNLERTNYNDFVHCIWFCISGPRLEYSEAEIIKKLKGVYKGNIMPIIFVYLQEINMQSVNHIRKFYSKGI